MRDSIRIESVPKIIFVLDDTWHGYEGDSRADVFLHYMNRLMNPLVKLNTDTEIWEFFDSSDKGLWRGDYETLFFTKSKAEIVPNLDEPIS